MDTLSMAVCPHDTVRNSEGWYRLVQYLAQHMGLDVHYALSLDFADFHSRYREADLVYANPSDSLRLIDQHGFTPLVRPTDTFDEALLVTGPDSTTLDLQAIAGAQVATVEGLLPTRLAMRLLQAKGIAPGGLVGRDSWLSVVRAVWSGEAPFGILYRDAYEELSPQGKAMVQVMETTSERCAFHVLCGAPRIGGHAGAIADALVAMAGDAAGKDVLADMQLVGWRPVSADELGTMRALLG
jgi:hypothetical protein